MTHRISRRRMLKRCAAASLAVAGATGFYTWQVEPHWLEVVRRPLRIRGCPPALLGKTLVQVSDLHAGERVSEKYLTNAMHRVAAMSPHIVVITGDFISYTSPAEFATIRRVLAPLAAHRKVFGIPGNHDYGYGWRDSSVANALFTSVASAGVNVLRNEIAIVDELQIVGIDDVWGTNFNPQRAFRQYDESRPAIALCHNPDVCDLSVWQNYQGWILAGHTHGGQCKPPFFPPPLLPVRNRRYVAGEYALTGDRRLYINRGVGHLMQVRFNVRPEITVFTMIDAR